MLVASPAAAVIVDYTITQASSSLTAGGSLAGSTASAQSTGSNVTSYTGTIRAERIGNTIQFLDGSSINADNKGNFQPASGGTPGSAAAKYGLQSSTQFGTARAAVRDLRFDLASSPLTIGAGNVIPNNWTTNVDDGVIDFNTGLQFGDVDLFGRSSSNTSGNPSSVVAGAGGQETLRLQFNIDFPYSALTSNDSNLNLVGTIIAVGVVPEPGVVSM